MANLTLTIDDDLLRRARIRALQQDTSVNALVRQWLEGYAEVDQHRRVTEEFLAIAEQSDANSGPEPWKWNRDEIYEERLARYDR
jgi:plasmid stability protein